MLCTQEDAYQGGSSLPADGMPRPSDGQGGSSVRLGGSSNKGKTLAEVGCMQLAT
jgi:hypothetical protein